MNFRCGRNSCDIEGALYRRVYIKDPKVSLACTKCTFDSQRYRSYKEDPLASPEFFPSSNDQFSSFPINSTVRKIAMQEGSRKSLRTADCDVILSIDMLRYNPSSPRLQ